VKRVIILHTSKQCQDIRVMHIYAVLAYYIGVSGLYDPSMFPTYEKYKQILFDQVFLLKLTKYETRIHKKI